MQRGMSGSANTAPLGSVRRPLGGGGALGGSLLNPSYMAPKGGDDSGDRKRTVETREGRPAIKDEGREERKKKRKSRWENEASKTCIPGLPTMIPAGLSKQQEEAYLLQLLIEDASRKLRSGDLGIPPNPEDRSPSPEPVYSSDGKRMNTREYRKRKELEESRHEAIQKMMLLNPEFKAPMDYRAPMIKVSDKVMIPQDGHPEINFMGLIIGPRGNTLKSLEKETGAKIIIRGKGSVKEGKVGRNNGQPLPGENEPLHAYVTSTDPECVKRAVKRVMQIIQEGIERPEGSNELRKIQLRELALLNGTLREDGQIRCTNCGADNHKAWQCQDKANVTNQVTCTACGGVGHISSDCKQTRPGMRPNTDAKPGSKIDREYMSLMAELGEGPPPPPPSGNDMPMGGGGGRPSKFDQRPQLMGPGGPGGPGMHGPGGPGGPGMHGPGGPGGPGGMLGPGPMGGGMNNRPDNDRWNKGPPMGQQQPPWGQGPPGNWGPRGPGGPGGPGGHGGPNGPGGHGGPGGPGPNWNGPPQQRGPPPGMGWNHGGQQQQQNFHNQGQYGGPPPPPPPGGKGGPQGNWGGPPSWGNGPPAPVPPPPRNNPMPFWAAPNNGGNQWQGGGNSNLSGLLGAPPPPPPPS